MRAADSTKSIMGPDGSAARASSPKPPAAAPSPWPAVPLALVKYLLIALVIVWFVYTAAGQ